MHSYILHIAFKTFVSFLLGLAPLVVDQVALAVKPIAVHFEFIFYFELWFLILWADLYDSQLRWTRMFCCFSKYLQPVDCAYLLKASGFWCAHHLMILH